MDTIVAALTEQHEALDALIAGLDQDGWMTPSECPGWTLADVVLHLAQTDELAIASVEGRFAEELAELARGVAAALPGDRPNASVDEGVERLVASQRNVPGAQIGERWRTRAAELRDRLRDCDPHARLTWITGEVAARTLATTRLAEAWIHTTDVSIPLGSPPVAEERLWHIARLAWRTLPYAFAMGDRTLSGPVAFLLRGPGGASWDFVPEEPAVTTISGDALELCLVAGRRAAPHETGLRGEGPDADAVLELVRTYA